MFENVFSPQQSAFEHVAARATGRRNRFVGDGFVAPDEETTFVAQPHKKIFVFATVRELRIKRFGWPAKAGQNVHTKKNVASAAFIPRHFSASRMLWPLTEAAFDDPR